MANGGKRVAKGANGDAKGDGFQTVVPNRQPNAWFCPDCSAINFKDWFNRPTRELCAGQHGCCGKAKPGARRIRLWKHDSNNPNCTPKGGGAADQQPRQQQQTEVQKLKSELAAMRKKESE